MIRALLFIIIVATQSHAMENESSTKPTVILKLSTLETLRQQIAELNIFLEERSILSEKDLPGFHKRLKTMRFVIDIDEAQQLTTCKDKLVLFIKRNSTDIDKLLKLNEQTFNSIITSEQKRGYMTEYDNYESQSFAKLVKNFYEDIDKLKKGAPASEAACKEMITDLDFWQNKAKAQHAVNFLWDKYQILINFEMLQEKKPIRN